MTTAVPTPQLRPHTPTCLTWRTPKNGKQQALSQNQVQITAATALVNAGVSLQSLMTLLGHVSAEMSLRYGRLFDSTVRTEYERALTAAKAHLGTLPTEPPQGRTQLPIVDGDWKQAPAVKARLAGGFCIRAQVHAPCPPRRASHFFQITWTHLRKHHRLRLLPITPP